GLMLVTLIASAWLIPARPHPSADEPTAFALPSIQVLPIGLIGLCAVFAEGASLDWSAVYLSDVLHHPAAVGAATVSIFSVCMAAARFGGDRIVQRFGPVTTVRLSGACATAGALIVVLTRSAVSV